MPTRTMAWVLPLLLCAVPPARAAEGREARQRLEGLERALSRPVPVYPGSKLDFQEAEERRCCAFVTGDAADQVGAFYQRSVKASVFDLPGLRKRYPEVTKGAALGQEPAGTTLRYVVLAEARDEQGRLALDALLIACAAGRCRYHFAAKRLLPADAHFQAEWASHFRAAQLPAGAAPRSALGKALPAGDLPGFTRQPVASEEGDAPSATVRWEKALDGGELAFYQLTLTDLALQKEGLADQVAAPPGTGFRKVKVNGAWPGIEELNLVDDGPGSGERRFALHGRYLVELRFEGRGSPVATFDRLCRELEADALPR